MSFFASIVEVNRSGKGSAYVTVRGAIFLPKAKK